MYNMADDTQLTMTEKDIKKYLRQLKTNKIGYFDVPEEYRLHPDMVKGERKLRIRRSDKRGYDVIRNSFFVEEIVYDKDSYVETRERRINNRFSDFASYYGFLDGDIYENACYYQYSFSNEEIDTYEIDMGKINFVALIDFTIQDSTNELYDVRLKEYEEREKVKTLRKKWIDKLNACNTYEEFYNIIKKYKESEFYKEYTDLLLILYNYIYSNQEKAFDNIMEFASKGNVYLDFVCAICSIYDAERVLESFNYAIGSRQTILKKKRILKKYINNLKNCKKRYKFKCYFDENTHFYCYQTTIEIYTDEYVQILKRNRVIITHIYRYFCTFHELADFLENDISGCDLSKAILPNIDFSIFKKNKKTKLPIINPDALVYSQNDLKYSIIKEYDRKKDCFVVRQNWRDKSGHIIKEDINTFIYFFDFIFFLNNDLSRANLIYCDGLNNLCDFSNINLKYARLKSTIKNKPEKKYPLFKINTTKIESFLFSAKNEDETKDALISRREDFYSRKELLNNKKINYISDLHLMHKLQNSPCKSKNDIICFIQCMIDSILKECDNFLLIGGDTASDFELFKLFIQLLRKSIDEKYWNITVIFLLGNHELWDFPDDSFEKIVQKYNNVISKHNMYLLQNDIIYIDDYNGIQKITTNEILTSSKESIRKRLISAKLILFGGLGFSGYNKEFNANNGIYRLTINRKQEIIESKKFEDLYNIVKSSLYDKRVIIFTHMPKKDWCSNNLPHHGFIYVSGHTHRNYFYDDGEYRIYADNQIGYKNEIPYSKYFYVEMDYDLFSEYDDGIYEITKEQYMKFYYGKNIMMRFRRDANIIYMLKKNGIYCFIHESQNKQLAILNGGVLQNLKVNDINYYYNRMDDVVAYINRPLDKFSTIQKKIANEIKAIGGSGTIHGAIIDIDFYNHIYVNPYDLTITGYWASDMINKKVFPSIPKLLETNCPPLYDNYLKRLTGKAETAIAIISDSKKGQSTRTYTYLDTDIYSASREIKKMQKLSSNILCEWYEPSKKMLE